MSRCACFNGGMGVLGSLWISASPWIQPPVMGFGCAVGSEVLGSGSLGSELYSVSFPSGPCEVWIL